MYKEQWRIQGPHPSPRPLFFDQNKARRAKKKFFGHCPPLSQGLHDPPPPGSEGLDLPLVRGYYCRGYTVRGGASPYKGGTTPYEFLILHHINTRMC